MEKCISIILLCNCSSILCGSNQVTPLEFQRPIAEAIVRELRTIYSTNEGVKVSLDVHCLKIEIESDLWNFLDSLDYCIHRILEKHLTAIDLKCNKNKVHSALDVIRLEAKRVNSKIVELSQACGGFVLQNCEIKKYILVAEFQASLQKWLPFQMSVSAITRDCRKREGKSGYGAQFKRRGFKNSVNITKNPISYKEILGTLNQGWDTK